MTATACAERSSRSGFGLAEPLRLGLGLGASLLLHGVLLWLAAADMLDRPLLDALARRIGKPLRVMSEQQLADGSRMIRFVGNVCLRIPQHLALGFENSLAPNVLVPSNCNA